VIWKFRMKIEIPKKGEIREPWRREVAEARRELEMRFREILKKG